MLLAILAHDALLLWGGLTVVDVRLGAGCTTDDVEMQHTLQAYGAATSSSSNLLRAFAR